MKLDLPLTLAILESPWFRGHQTQGMLLGDSPEIFLFILRLSVLLHHPSTPGHDTGFLTSQLSAIQLDLWQYYLDNFVHCSSMSETYEGKLISELYYWACQALVQMILKPDKKEGDESVQYIVLAFMDVLERISTGSPANGVLCWPLFIIGLCTASVRHQSAISTRLKTIEVGSRSFIPIQTSRYLSQRWKQQRSHASEASSDLNVAVSRLALLDLPVILV